MGKKIFSLLAAVMFVTSAAIAQVKVVTGQVVDADSGEPLSGAKIVVLGTGKGTIADVNGNFKVEGVPANAKNLVISFTGMKSVEVPIRANMKIALETENSNLNQVMVVAYGTQKKSSFTGSATVVGADEIGKVQATNAVDAIKGKAAGVQIYTSSGQPGSEPSIRIRGFNSILAGQSPLIILDGSPYDGSLNDIAPSDIESINVLKDAASTALYGARGGNGVIMVTTKSAKKGQDATITFEGKWGGKSRATETYDRISDPRGYYEAYYQGLYNYGVNKYGYNADQAWQYANANMFDRTTGMGLGYNVFTVPEGQYLIGRNGKLNPNAVAGRFVQGLADPEMNPSGIYFIQPESWEDAMYKGALRQEYNMTASGSHDRGTWFASLGYLGDEGIVAGSDYERINARIKADYQIKSWLKMGANVSFSHANQNHLDSEDELSSGNIFAMQNMAPIYPVYYRGQDGQILSHRASGLPAYDYGDGSVLPFTRAWLNQSNPLSDNLVNKENYEGNTFNGIIDANVYLYKGLTFTSINNVFLTETRYTGVTNPWFGQYASSNGIITKQHTRYLTTNFQQRLNYHTQLGQGEKHDLELTAGHEYFKSHDYGLYYGMSNMFNINYDELSGAVVPGKGSSSRSTYNSESFFFRGMYNYDERYFVQASVVGQGSSNFHPDHRWGVFYSASAGWMINKEKWFKAKWVDELKIKASYGENGNDFGLGGYIYTDRFGISNSNNEVSLTPSTLKMNELLSWEKNAKFNVGVDFSLFNERLWGGFEYYNNRTNDMISRVSFAPSFGYTSYYANSGNMRNSGVELDLHADVIRTKDFKWNIYANITSNSNKILELDPSVKKTEVDGRFGYSSGNYFYTEGESRYTYYGYKYAGVYNESNYYTTGDAEYDPTKGGMALYYNHVYVRYTEADKAAGRIPEGKEVGDVVMDAEGKKVLDMVNTTTTPGTDSYFLLGDVLPKAYGGFGTSLNWKGLDFSVDFQYQLGGKVFDDEYQSLMSFNPGYGMHNDMLKAWSPTNTSSNIPRIQYGDTYMAATSDRFLTSASYITLGNITIGYTLPKKVARKMHMQKFRIFAVADNIYTWSARKGLDPRQSLTGASSGTMHPFTRAISGGVSITF